MFQHPMQGHLCSWYAGRPLRVAESRYVCLVRRASARFSFGRFEALHAEVRFAQIAEAALQSSGGEVSGSICVRGCQRTPGGHGAGPDDQGSGGRAEPCYQSLSRATFGASVLRTHSHRFSVLFPMRSATFSTSFVCRFRLPLIHLPPFFFRVSDTADSLG